MALFSRSPAGDAGSSVKSSSGRRSRRRIFGWRGPRGGVLSPQGGSMASYNGVLKDYSHSSLNEAFKSQNNVNFKLIKTGEQSQSIRCVSHVCVAECVRVCVSHIQFVSPPRETTCRHRLPFT